MKSPTLALIASLTASCATIVGDSNELVQLKSDPPGASVSVVNEGGENVFQGTTPTSVMLKKGRGYFDGETYSVRFERDGFEPGLVLLDTGLSGWYVLGNIVFGGLIGWLIVDPLTGAMWKLDDSVLATLQPVRP